MRNVHVDFTPQIQARAKASGREISGGEIAVLDQALNSLLDLDPATLRLSFALGGGRFGSLGQALDQLTPQPQRMAA